MREEGKEFGSGNCAFVSPSLSLQAAKQRIESEAAAQRQPGILQRWFPGWMSGYQWQPQQQGADQVGHTRVLNNYNVQCTCCMCTAHDWALMQTVFLH